MDSIPVGYKLARYMLEWESQCQAEGWTALDNMDGEMEHVISCYALINMKGEAAAVSRAYEQWKLNPEDHKAIGLAYKRAVTEMPDDSARISYLIAYLADNADELFHQMAHC